jgi:hypothetical protein
LAWRRQSVAKAGRVVVWLAKAGENTMRPTDDEIMRALCFGAECAVGPKSTGYCHRWDFASEAVRIRAMLDRYGKTCIDRSSEPEEA